MTEQQVVELIVNEVIQRLKEHEKQMDKKIVPINISARHIHLSQAHVEALFGPGYQLTKLKDLGQPGQFACNETVAVSGPKGSFPKVRVLGPARGDTQLEIALSDARVMGVDAPVRLSGNIEGTPGMTIKGPAGEITVDKGVIAAARHIHMTPEDAANFGVTNGQLVRVRTTGVRPLTFDDVVVRVSPTFALEMHVDTDEGNAAGIKDGAPGEIVG